MSQRTYSESEVTELLKRAAELETMRRSSGRSDDSGLTLEEIEAIAADAGLDPENLRIAAKEMERPGIVRAKSTADVRGSEISAERWVNGTLTEEAIEEVVAELRHRYDSQSARAWGMGDYGRSTVQTIGKSVEWHHTDIWGMYETKVLMQPRGDKVRVRVSLRSAYGSSWESSKFWSWFVGLCTAVPIGGAALVISGSPLVGGLFGLVGLAVTIPFFRGIFERYTAKYVDKVETLANEVTRTLSAWQPNETAARSSAARQNQLLDDLGDKEAPSTRERQDRLRTQ